MNDSENQPHIPKITKEGYNIILQLSRDSNILLYIDTVSFKDFFANIDKQIAKELFGEELKKEISFAKIVPRIEVLLLLSSFIFAILLSGWYSVLIILIIILFHFIIKGRASSGRHEIKSPLAILLLASLFILLTEPNLWLSMLIFNLSAIYFLNKAYYYFIAKWVFAILHRNYEFFRFFYERKSPYYPKPVDIPFLWYEKI